MLQEYIHGQIFEMTVFQEVDNSSNYVSIPHKKF
jgi:hypothetical protein